MKPCLCLVLCFLLPFTVAAPRFSLAQEELPAHSNSGPAIEIHLDPGELLSLISLRNRNTPEARQALQVYGREAITLAHDHGFENHGTLRVIETVVGDQAPELFILGTWPSEERDLAFEALPDMQPYKEMRPIIWDELKFYKDESEAPTTLRFRADRHYTIAFAWHDPAMPEAYRSYLDHVTPAVEGAGGRFIHTLMNPRFVAESSAAPGPSEINIVEWDTAQGLDELQTSKAFLQNYDKLHAGTTRFELYRAVPVDPGS